MSGTWFSPNMMLKIEAQKFKVSEYVFFFFNRFLKILFSLVLSLRY